MRILSVLFVLLSLFAAGRVHGLADTLDSGYPQIFNPNWVAGLPSGLEVDAIFQRHSNGKIYLFSGTQYYRISDMNLVNGNTALTINTADTVDSSGNSYPQSISAKFPGIPTPVEAVFARTNGKIYFFSNGQYYRVTDKYTFDNPLDTVDAGYPQAISAKWIGVPSESGGIDAVFERWSTGHIYFFSGTQLYRVADKYWYNWQDTSIPDTVDAGYPQNIADKFENAPIPVATAYHDWANDQIALFSDTGLVYQFSDKYIVDPVDAYAITAPACPTPPAAPADDDEAGQGSSTINVNFANIFAGLTIAN